MKKCGLWRREKKAKRETNVVGSDMQKCPYQRELDYETSESISTSFPQSGPS